MSHDRRALAVCNRDDVLLGIPSDDWWKDDGNS